MNMTTIDSIIFDFGGVLIDIDYHATEKAFNQLKFDGFDSFYSQAKQSDLFDDFETGKIQAEAFISALREYLPETVSDQEITHAWNAMLLSVPIEGIDLLKKLSAKYKLFMLSNTNEIHIDVAKERWEQTAKQPLEEHFNKVYLSHEIGFRKPNKDAFDFVCEQESLDPSRTLFIDDTSRHIDGAKNAGLQTILLSDIKGLSSLFEE